MKDSIIYESLGARGGGWDSGAPGGWDSGAPATAAAIRACGRRGWNRMAGCGGCVAACSFTTPRCTTNGFSDPDTIFSISPLPDTTSSHLRREQNRPHLVHRNLTNQSKRRKISFPASCVLTAGARGRAGRAHS
jgi:hypothetical protein